MSEEFKAGLRRLTEEQLTDTLTAEAGRAYSLMTATEMHLGIARLVMEEIARRAARVEETDGR